MPDSLRGLPTGLAEAAPRRAFAWRVMWDVPMVPWALRAAVCLLAEAVRHVAVDAGLGLIGSDPFEPASVLGLRQRLLDQLWEPGGSPTLSRFW